MKPILDEVSANCIKQHNITVQVEGEAEEFLADAGWSPEYGVRELHRTVERLIQIPLSRLVLSGELTKYSHWQITCTGEGILIVPITS